MLKLNGLAKLLVPLFVAMEVTEAAAPPSYAPKLEAIYSQLEEIAKSPVLQKAVEDSNAGIHLEDLKGMDNSKWQRLAVRDPLVQMIVNAELSVFLRRKFMANIAEAFVNDGKGNKVAMLAKSSKWNHSGHVKHEQAMRGRRWMGEPEFDASTGFHQIQIAVPIYNSANKVIGSIVVGVKIASLR